MKKSIFLFFAAILCAIGMQAKTTATVYYSIPASTVGCYTVKCYYNFGYSQTGLVEMTKEDKTSNGNLIYSVKLTADHDNVDELLFQLFDGNTWKSQKTAMSGWTALANNSGKMYNHSTSKWVSYTTDPSYTVYYVDQNNWGSNIRAYAWNSDCDKNQNWSGASMTSTGKKYNGKNIYFITFEKRYNNIIFSKKGENQTNDLTLGTTNAGKMFTHASKTGDWIAYTYDVKVTFDANGHGTAPLAQTVLKGNKITEPVALSEEGYTFGGWYKETECTTPWNFNTDVLNDDVTLYAKWTEITHTVTFASDGNGTTNQTGEVEVGVITGIAIDATPNTDYEFNVWESSNGGTFATTAADASNTFYPTANTTLTATFRSTAVNALLVVAGENIESVAGSTDPIVLGESYNIKATPVHGYKFNLWTANPAGNAAFDDASSATTQVKVQNGSVTVTASATEILAELTTANAFDAGTPSIAAPTASATEIGVATTATVTATEAPSGYTFVGWTLTNCERTDGGAENAATITLKSTGTNAAAQVTANYEIDKYYVVGSFNGWTTEDANYEMTYDNGVYKKEVTFAKDVEFKICFGNWNGDWGANNLGGIEYKEIEGKDGNIKLTTGATFTIIFNRAKHLITFEGLTRNYDYVLMGVDSDWTTGIAMTVNPDNTDEYTLKNQTIYKSTDAVKVVTLTNGTATAWCGNVDSWSNAKYTTDKDGNIVLEDGIYDFYFKVSDDNIYINQTGYVRNVTIDNYGTICLPYASSSFTGATFYEVSYLVEGQGLWLDQLADGVQLEAGKPYIFKATDSEIKVTYTGEAKDAPVDGANGLTGTFTDIGAGGLIGNYIIAENQVWSAGTGATLSANRAYIDASLVPTTAQAQLPGRRRVQMGENAATGLDNITNGENTVIKTIENGQLIIIRNGEKFNALGVRF